MSGSGSSQRISTSLATVILLACLAGEVLDLPTTVSARPVNHHGHDDNFSTALVR